MTERVIRVTLDPRGVRTGGSQAEGALRRVADRAKRTSESMRTLRTAVGAAFAAFSARELVQAADAFTNVGNRIRLVTDSQAELNAVREGIVALAQDTRSSLGATAELYERTARAADRFGLSQNEIIDVTRAVNQAAQISGATNVEAANATRQFTQALAGGVLRAEEFNSIIEQTPRLASAIEEGLGLAAGTLRNEVVAGTVSAEDALRALQSQASDLNDEFDTITPTVSQAITTFRNFATVVVGSFNDAAGVTEGFVNIFSLTGEETVLLANRVTDLGLAFREFVEVATVSIANFAEGVAPRFQTLIDTIVGGIAVLLDNDFVEQVSRDSIAANEAQLAAIRERLDAEFDLIRRNAEARREAAEAGRGGSGVDLDLGRLTASTQDLAAFTDEQQKFLDNLLLQEEALARAAETGEEYSQVLEELQIRQLAAGDAAFEFDAIQTLIENRRLADQIDQQNVALERAADIFEQTRTAAEQYNEQIAEAQRLLDDGLIDEDTFLRFEQTLRQSLLNADDAFLTFLEQARRNAQDLLGEALADIFTDGLDDIPSRFARILQQLASQYLASEIFRLLSGLGNNTGAGGGGGGILQSLGTFFGGNFGGGRMTGGPVSAGETVLVGEGGAGANPELFTPSTSGTITPINQLMQAPPEVNVTNVNVFDERAVLDIMASSAGRRVQLNNITRTRTQTKNALRS